jgi:hypothetical protein
MGDGGNSMGELNLSFPESILDGSLLMKKLYNNMVFLNNKLWISLTAPSLPYKGQHWEDLTNNILKRWNGLTWDNLAGSGSSPVYAGLTINGNIVCTGTVDGVDISARDHNAVTVSAAPLTLATQVLTFNYDTNDFQLSGNNLQVKDGGVSHSSLADLNSASYTHLTSANHTDLTDTGATTLHKHDHGGMDGLVDNDHTQYLLRQPTADVVINESGGDFDFRIEGDTDANLFYLDAGADKIGLGTNSPGYKLDIQSTGNDYLRIGTTDATGAAGVIFANDSANRWSIYSTSGTYALNFYYTTLNVLTLLQSGNVGIGLTNPGYGLHVANSIADDKMVLVQNSNSSYNTVFRVRSSADSKQAGIEFGNNTVGKMYIYKPESSGDLAIYDVVNSKELVRIQSGGNVGIGVTNPTHLFHLNGGAYCDGTGDWIAGSDIAYKKNIVDLKKYGLNEVLNLKPVSFIHKQDKNNKIQLGFIAQDVKKFIPEVVDGEEGSYGLEYNRLIPVLVNAIKELNQKIKILEKGVSAQNEVIKDLIKRIEKLEK